MMSLLSKALSAISAPNSIPSISGGMPTVSKRCPGNSTNRTRLPRASVRARILVVMPPLERPMAWLPVPLLRPFHGGLVRGSIEKPFENITLDPVSIPLEDRVPGAEQRRQIAPRAARSRDPQHRLDKAPVVLAAATRVRLLPQAMRFHLRPLGVAQHISIHPKLESQSHAWGNPKSPQTLVWSANMGESTSYRFGVFRAAV